MRTVDGHFSFRGNAAFASGAISLLVSLQASGCKLTKFECLDSRKVFVESGVISFQVSGTKLETDIFLRSYND